MDRIRERLLEEFPPSNREDWEAKIIQDCRGEDYAEKLIWNTPEQIDVRPFYCAEDIKDLEHSEALPGSFPFVRGNKKKGNPWEIRQDILVHNVPEANKKALFLIEKGVHATGFDIRKKVKLEYGDFKRLIDNVDLEKIALHWMTEEDPAYLLDSYRQFSDEKKADPWMFKGSVGFDPIGRLTCTGGFQHSFEVDMELGERLLHIVNRVFPSIRVIMVDGRYLADAGASCIQELGFSLAIAAEYLSFYTDRGVSVEDIAPHMQLNLGTGSNYFFEMAKIRAARMLWSNLLMSFDKTLTERSAVHIQSITTNRNKTIYDSRVNLLRLTTEAMASILGGCDALLVRPYDDSYRETDDFSERLARNIQIILREESYFDKVADPAGGAYYIESLTDAICSNAWQKFLETEKTGGYLEAFKRGSIQDEIRENAEKMQERIACGKQIILGINDYPDYSERIFETMDRNIAFYGQRYGIQSVAAPVVPLRASAEFEKIRLATEKHPNGRPKVFMLTYGDPAMRHARSQFAGNFFGSAGYEVIDNPGFDSLSWGVTSALDAKADIIVACSNDEEYADSVPEIYNMTKGKAILVVAGAPASMNDLKSQGIMNFIYVGINMIETLKYYQNELGITL